MVLKISSLKLLESDPALRIEISKKLENFMLQRLTKSTKKIAKALKIREVSLRRKLLGRTGYSFKLTELLVLTKKADITKKELFSNINKVKIGSNSYWVELLKYIKIDQEFVEGVGYYIGDGRMKTDRGLSTRNTNVETLNFFIKWLKKYFSALKTEIRVEVLLPRTIFDTAAEKNKWSKLLNLSITSVKTKHKHEEWHKEMVEVGYFRKITKRLLDKLIPIVKKRCLNQKDLAMAYIKGIMIAEGCVKHNEKRGTRAIHLKMKDKNEVKYVFNLLRFIGLEPSFLFSRQDNEWVVTITSYDELKRLNDLKIFKFHSDRKNKLKEALKGYKHYQVKKGTVNFFYLSKLLEFEKDSGTHFTVNNLLDYINKDKNRILVVLKELQKNGFIVGERMIQTGRPFRFALTEKGKEFISK
tara:strand:+ start:58099 stop:59340 length:1242 start_codon:yes stop_codon:yes gene_type:complete